MIASKTTLLFVLPLLALLVPGTGARTSLPRQNVVSPSTISKNKLKEKPAAFHDDGAHAPLRGDPTLFISRGGGGADAPSKDQLTGLSIFIAIEVVLRNIFQVFGISFPTQLAGCVLLFAFLNVAQVVSPGLGDTVSKALTPGAGLLAKWMGVFFVPGLIMLPLAPSIGSSAEIIKCLGILIIGFYYSLAIVTYSVLGVRKLLGAVEENTTADGGQSTADGGHEEVPKGVVAKLYDQGTVSFFLKGAVTTGLLCLALNCNCNRDNLGARLNKPVETLCFGCITLGSYVWGANLPPAFTKICNPILTSAIVTLGVAKLIPSIIKNVAFEDVLKSYTCKKSNLMEMGAGDLLLYLLNPSVISFGVGMYKGKDLMAANIPAVATAVLTGSIGSMFGTATAARLLNLGGPDGQVLRLAAIPRSTQTALGMTIVNMLGGDIAIGATLIILTGIFGGMFGVKTLNAWGVKDSVSRGLGMGSAGLSLGVVSIKSEPEAFAFAGLCLVLTAVSATCLVSVPAVKELLIAIAGGASI